MKGIALICCTVLVLLTSCFGVNADITLNADGSGSIQLEYRIDESLYDLGMLDGNERWNTIPVGRADFERTVARLPGMRLRSHSQREESYTNIIITTVRLDFSNIETLLAFLDASGNRSVMTGNAGGGSLMLTLSDGETLQSDELKALIAKYTSYYDGNNLSDYTVRIGITFPHEANLALTDKEGKPLESSKIEVQPRGRTVSLTVPLREILTNERGIRAEFRW